MKKLLFTLSVPFLLSASLMLSTTSVNASISDSNNSQVRSIIGKDERVRITDTTLAPYNSTVFIAADGAAGSGAVIGKNTVLTAAHVVKNIRVNPDKDSIYVVPGRNGSKIPYGKFKIESVHIPQSYVEKPSVDSDIAVLTIKPLNNKGIGEVVPSLPLKLTNSATIGETLTTSGFPGDKQWGTMWAAKGSILRETKTRVYYDMDTMGGQSGSPVYNSNNEVIAVHTTGAGIYNFGTKINDEYYQFISNYLL
ncbi:trypsin-like serine peptidase [Latilactobacillus fragifolii]|uniref:trypsin-like serine peptidase n=1 Tax=Latilactobacillus fragifolii TaxID=2814244 RepID=UPI001F3F29BE|nr:serine protease [Latilactobacillus fragifolii]